MTKLSLLPFFPAVTSLSTAVDTPFSLSTKKREAQQDQAHQIDEHATLTHKTDGPTLDSVVKMSGIHPELT